MAEISLADINRRAATDPAALVASAERDFHGKLKDLADTVRARGVRTVLLAGPSASGKTTSANLLADALRAAGRPAAVISLDNFYRDAKDPDYPRLENGERDLECVGALRLDKIREMLLHIGRGEGFSVPTYDFLTASPRAEETFYPPMGGGTVILEGLHALNPRITDKTGEDILRVFVSLSTNLQREDGTRLMSGRKMRFVRRLVRDFRYRGADAARTLALWKNVLIGEQFYLYPFKSTADVMVDTFHAYEPGALAPYAKEALGGLTGDSPILAALSELLEKAVPVDLSLVPEESLLREFLPGGIYEELY